MGMKSQMLTMSLMVTSEQFDSLTGGDSFFNLSKILSDLDNKVRTETDEHTFGLLYDLVQKDREDLVFETIWALHTGNSEDKTQLDAFYHAVLTAYQDSLEIFAASLCEDEWEVCSVGDSLVMLTTGGVTYSGQSPTDAYDLARLLFWNSDGVPYGDWLYDQLNVDVEKFFQQKYGEELDEYRVRFGKPSLA